MSRACFSVLTVLIALAISPSVSWGKDAPVSAKHIIDTTPLTHKWVKDACDGQICQLSSTYQPPFPFSQSVRSEAILAVEIDPMSKAPPPLATVLKHEIADARKNAIVVEYEEQDHAVHNNVASWTETVHGKTVGFIKYRAKLRKNPMPLPFTVIDAIMRTDHGVYYAHTIMLFAGHSDEVYQDQHTLIEKLVDLK